MLRLETLNSLACQPKHAQIEENCWFHSLFFICPLGILLAWTSLSMSILSSSGQQSCWTTLPSSQYGLFFCYWIVDYLLIFFFKCGKYHTPMWVEYDGVFFNVNLICKRTTWHHTQQAVYGSKQEVCSKHGSHRCECLQFHLCYVQWKQTNVSADDEEGNHEEQESWRFEYSFLRSNGCYFCTDRCGGIVTWMSSMKFLVKRRL